MQTEWMLEQGCLEATIFILVDNDWKVKCSNQKTVVIGNSDDGVIIHLIQNVILVKAT